MFTQVCAYDHEGLYWLTFCATSCTFCLPWVHFECSVCTFVPKVHFCAYCSYLWICKYCAFLHILWPICNFVYQSNGSGYCVLLCQPEKKSGSIFGTWRRIINEVSSSNHLVFFYITFTHGLEMLLHQRCRTVSYKYKWVDGIGWSPGGVRYRAPYGAKS